MSEFLAEAAVLIRPDTTKFRAQLEAELTAIIGTAKLPPVVVPVAAVAAEAGTGAAVVAQKDLAAAAVTTTASVEGETAALTVNATAARENAVALIAQSDSTQAASAALAKLIPAEVLDADAARAAGVAHAEAAASTAAHAKRLGTLERGAAASGLSLLGIRGATLAASGSFLAGAAAVTILAKSVKEATAEQEALARVNKVVGAQLGAQLEKNARGFASSLGLSTAEALKFEGSLAEVFHNLGLSDERTAAFSEQVVKLAADMAAFNNTSPEVTLKALQLGISGNLRSLRPYIGALRQADVTNEALRESNKKSTKELTSQELALARLTLIQRATANQVGAAAARSGELAQQSRVLSANLANLGVVIGRGTLPVLVQLTDQVNLLFQGVQKLQGLRINIPGLTDSGAGKTSFLGKVLDETKGFAISFAGPAGLLKTELNAITEGESLLGVGAAKAVPDVDKLTTAVQKLLDAGRKTGGVAGINEILTGLDKLTTALRASGPAGVKFAEQLQALRDQIAKTGDIPANFNLRAELRIVNLQEQATKQHDAFVQALEVQFGKPIDLTAKANIALSTQFTLAQAVGTQQQQLAIAKQQAEQARKSLVALLGLPADTSAQEVLLVSETRKTSKSRAGAVAKAAALLQQANSEITSINSQQAADAKSAADKAKTAAQKLKTAQDAANQAFLDAFAPKEQARQNAIVSAGLTARLSDDIKANRALIQFERDEINAIRDRIRRLNLHGDRLKAAVAAIRAAQQKIFDASNAIFGLEKQRADARKAALQAATDARQAHLEALLSIAETTTRTTDDQRVLKALIRFDDIQIKRLQALKKRRKLTQTEAAQLDAYRVDVAQRNKALHDLTDEQKKGATIQQAEFKFLQTQQGFAANLIGNLIPLGAAGLVGGSAPAPAIARGGGIPELGGTGGPSGGISGSTSVSFFAQAAQEHGAAGFGSLAAATARSEANRNRGVTAGQGERQIDWLRRIWNELKFINQGRDHPEAHHQRRVNSARQDTAIMTHGM